MALETPLPELSKKRLLAVFLQKPEVDIQIKRYYPYLQYYHERCLALKYSASAEADYMINITHEHILAVVNSAVSQMQEKKPCYRNHLRRLLLEKREFRHYSEQCIEQTINLALRLWLLLNVRDVLFAPGTRAIQWNDDLPLQEFVAAQFPGPSLLIHCVGSNQDTSLPSSFTVANMRRFSGIRIEWTHSLCDHLLFDKDHRTLQIFPLKLYLQGLKIRYAQDL